MHKLVYINRFVCFYDWFIDGGNKSVELKSI
jgi:hypothetical protein